MNLEVFNIIVFFIGIITGFISALILKIITFKGAKSNNMSNSNTITIKSLQKEIDEKQVFIDDFFSDSSMNLLAAERHIAELRTSISNGASQLSHVQVPSVPNTIQESSKEDFLSEPPRDYAPKDKIKEGYAR